MDKRQLASQFWGRFRALILFILVNPKNDDFILIPLFS